MAEREGGDSSDEEGEIAQTVGRKIQDQDNGCRRVEEGHQWLKAKAALFYANDRIVESTDPVWI